MRSLIIRLTSVAALASMLAAPVAPALAQSSSMSGSSMAVTGNALGAITKLANKYFSAVAGGDLEALQAITTPTFTATKLNGKGTTDAAGLIAEAKAASLSVNQVTGGAKAQSATTNGTTAVAMVQIQATGNSLQSLQNMSISRNALHQMTLTKTAAGWKISQDRVVKAHTTM